ncbi:MAG: hypothetical protein ABFS08_03895 [Pseudomonadota bacterium]
MQDLTCHRSTIDSLLLCDLNLIALREMEKRQMRFRHWMFMIFSLMIVTGCSSDESYAKKLILVSLKNTNAVQFVEFTRFDDKNACYEVNIRNHDGREQTAYVSLNKDNASDQEWSHWATTESLDECREAIKRQPM